MSTTPDAQERTRRESTASASGRPARGAGTGAADSFEPGAAARPRSVRRGMANGVESGLMPEASLRSAPSAARTTRGATKVEFGAEGEHSTRVGLQDIRPLPQLGR